MRPTDTRMLGQFRVIRRLAAGGMSEVYLAEEPSMGRQCALKVVVPSRAWSPENAQRLRQEARTASRLNHPNIVTLYSFTEQADGTLVLAMEYIDGPDLRQLLRTGPLSPQSAVDITCQCCRALAYAHSRNVVHRDLKPANVMVARVMGESLVKLVDFGFAQLLVDVGAESKTFVGSPRYVSPEQCRGEGATPLSDQYALGLVVHEMLTGRPAVEGSDLFVCLHEHQHGPVPQPSTHRAVAELKAFDPIVGRMTAKDPGKRYPGMREVMGAFECLRSALSPDRGVSPATDIAYADGVEIERHSSRAMPKSRLLSRLASLPLFGVDTLLRAEDRKQVETMSGLRPTHGTSRHSASLTSENSPQLGVLSLRGATWPAASTHWLEVAKQEGARARPSRLLVCIDGPPDAPKLLASLKQFDHVILGPHPLDPLPLSAALGWMQRTDGVGIEHFISTGTIQARQVRGSAQRGLCIDEMLRDVKAAGVRLRGRNALSEIAEELILNALCHARHGSRNAQADAPCDSSPSVVLSEGEEVTVRWVVCEEAIVFSVRDCFGSLTAELVAKHFAAVAPRQLRIRQSGVRIEGLGLRITARAARYLTIAISPGNWCEIVAIIDRIPSATVKKSLCLLTGLESDVRWIGERLRARDQWDGTSSTIELTGEINETCDFGPICARTGPVRLDLGGITRINSIGISAWIEAWEGRASGSEVTLVRCSPAMVRQFNNVPRMIVGQVVSLFAPYYCRQCDAEVLILMDVELLSSQAKVPSPQSCVACGNLLEFDELEREYFAFLDYGPL